MVEISVWFVERTGELIRVVTHVVEIPHTSILRVDGSEPLDWGIAVTHIRKLAKGCSSTYEMLKKK